jgi:long-chain acyl-CoA synthetase
MIWYQGRARSFAEVEDSSSLLAGGLVTRLGIEPGDRVAILDKNSDRYLELVFAVDKAGAICVPINWRLTATEVAQVVEDAEPKLLVVGEEFRDRTERLSCRVLGFSELPQAAGDPHRDREDAVAWMLYTSGTTGRPKGVMLYNLNLFSLIGPLGFEVPELQEGTSALVAMPLFHIGGIGWGLAVVSSGATAVIVREVIPQELPQLLVERRVATAFVVPAVLLLLTQVPEVGGMRFPDLRNLVYGASPIAEDLLRRSIEAFGCRFTQVYGLTETTGAVTALTHEHHQGPRLLSCGRPMFGQEIRIMGPRGEDLPVGEVGEVGYRGPGIMVGYWRQPEETATVLQEGWLRTGDAGCVDEDGFVYIRDRIKDVIVSGGENVYPAEVEGMLLAHPAVADCAVIGVPDDRWGETVKAIVVRRPGMEVTEAELIAWARGRIAGFKRPRSVDFVASLPRNPSGKVLKRQLREPYWAGRERRVN